MVRPNRRRRVGFNPKINYFKPAGVPIRELKEVVLKVDELEAVRLCDAQGLKQEEAADKMNVSQSTLFRILSNARRKIAEALVEGKSIKIQGGNYEMMKRGIGKGRGRGFQGPASNCVCPKCGYTQMKRAGMPCMSIKCPECGSTLVRGD